MTIIWWYSCSIFCICWNCCIIMITNSCEYLTFLFNSILGMNLFGCKFCESVGHGENQWTKCGRKNFDSLLWAIITVFQVQSSGPSKYKDCFSRHRDSHYKDKMDVKLLNLDNGNPYTGKTASLYCNRPLHAHHCCCDRSAWLLLFHIFLYLFII